MSFWEFLDALVDIVAGLLIVAVLILLVIALYAYIRDITQHQHTIRRNYPLIGRFRYFFEHLGVFFRQYFFALDREEMPFNRAERSWIYRASKKEKNTLAFGSSNPLNKPGSIIFVNSQYPINDKDAQAPQELVFGPQTQNPYKTRGLLHISAMSFGAISKPAVQALSMGAAQSGCWLNTGEGGLSPYHLEADCDIVFQIGTAKYGVCEPAGVLNEEKLKVVAKHPQVKMFEIKLSQGAKPGKGGILPAAKVTAEIASIRGIKAGQASISPNSHQDVNNIDDLLDLIERVRSIAQKPVGIKTVISDAAWLDEFCMAVLKRGKASAPDFITVDGGDGGTGAAPATLIDNMGLPLSESLPMLTNHLQRTQLNERIKVIASGKMVTPVAVAWALCVGADAVTSARGFMFALGCIQSLQCNKNTCPTGVATHDENLQKGLNTQVKKDRVANYVQQLEKEAAIIAHSCGVTEPRQLQRKHARMVISSHESKPLDEIYM